MCALLSFCFHLPGMFCLQASWIMKGVIDFLVGDSAEAAWLRERFVFKLVRPRFRLL